MGQAGVLHFLVTWRVGCKLGPRGVDEWWRCDREIDKTVRGWHWDELDSEGNGTSRTLRVDKGRG